mgnify:CR=1 FL=1|jgi:hypothetical protein
MKKWFVMVAMLTVMTPFAAVAQETAREDLPQPASTERVSEATRQRWKILSWGIWFDVPRSVNRTNVDGVKIGLPISSGRVRVHGLELSLFCSATDRVNGMQFAPVNLCKRMGGFQMAFVNVAGPRSSAFQLGLVNTTGKGAQVGLVNVADGAGFQFGLLNFNAEGFLPFFPIVNF